MPMQSMNKKKVLVGLSGGVDSSVSAALLKARGFDVTGVFIKGWYPDWQECNWKEDRRDAMRVCALLDIPFLTLDLEKEYKKQVVDYMIREYKVGRTPNPDVMCNKEIKFGKFLEFAKSNGANFVATGHYARTKELRSKNKKSRIVLKKGTDANKDQSYFLWTLTQDQLKHIIFPVGHLTKSKVRKLASKLNLPTAGKKDSQGLCFIGKVDMKDFLAHYVRPKKGKVLDEHGKVIGSHDGAIFLTIGQRHGFEVKNRAQKSVPYYVIAKNLSKNTITVSRKISSEVSRPCNKILLEQTNWIEDAPSYGVSYDVKLRYRQESIKAKIKKERRDWIVELSTQSVKISPGQSLVVYLKDAVIGGGVISKAL